MRCRKKRRPPCNGADIGLQSPRGSTSPGPQGQLTSGGCSVARERVEPSAALAPSVGSAALALPWASKGGTQMTATGKEADAPLDPSRSWKATDWPAISETVRRLQVTIAEVASGGDRVPRDGGASGVLEPYEGKLSRTVLGGAGAGNRPRPTRSLTRKLREDNASDL